MASEYGWCQSCGALVVNSPQCHKCGGEVETFCVDMELVGLKERIKELEAKIKQHRWIPVSERLPEKEQVNGVMSKEVFVSDGREVWKARCVVSGKRWSYTNSPSATLPITHWKPIILP